MFITITYEIIVI